MHNCGTTSSTLPNTAAQNTYVKTNTARHALTGRRDKSPRISLGESCDEASWMLSSSVERIRTMNVSAAGAMALSSDFAESGEYPNPRQPVTSSIRRTSRTTPSAAGIAAVGTSHADRWTYLRNR